MTEESDNILLGFIKALSVEDAKEYFIGKRIVDQWGRDRGVVEKVGWFSRGRMNFKSSSGDALDYCDGLTLRDGLYYCCSGLRGRIVVGDSGCFKCIYSCKMSEPCVFMEEKK